MSKEQDKVFFRNFSLVVGALAVMMVIFIIAARIIGIDESMDAEQRAASVAERTSPMGEVYLAGEKEEDTAAMAGAETGTETGDGTGNVGKEVYDSLCVSCHGSGIPGIPQLGDADAWAPRIAQGNEMLYKNAIDGFTGESGMMMPPKGGNTELSDEDVKAAVDYIVAKSQ